LPAHEDPQRGAAQHQHAQGQRGAAAGLGQLLDAIGQRDDADHAQATAGQVDGDGGIARAHRHVAQRQQRGHGDDGHVDQEHRAPPEMLQQGAAQQRPHGRATGGDCGPDADGQRQLARVLERHPDDGDGRRQHGGAADCQQHPRADEHCGGRRQGRQHGGHAKHDITDCP